jgi:glycosyltransferase involved in cell wall biosynthesis
MPSQSLRVLLVAEHASARFGGEAALPLHYFRILRRRGIDVWMVVHERTRSELESVFPDDCDRIYYVPDTLWHRAAHHLGKMLPAPVHYITLGYASRLLSQLIQRQIIRKAIRTHQISLIHQPTPVSPKEPSLIFGLGVPVVMGPMNGGMEYPPAFRGLQNRFTHLSIHLGRKVSNFLNWLMPGKLQADMLLIANPRTRNALPKGIRGQVIELVENGVDLSIWQAADSLMESAEGFRNSPGLTYRRKISVRRSFFGVLSNMMTRRIHTTRRLAATDIYSKYRRYLPTQTHLDHLAQTSPMQILDQATVQAAAQFASTVGAHPPLTFVYVGRLVGWKAVDCLLEAFQRITETVHANLDIIGDGVQRASLEQQARDLDLLPESAGLLGQNRVEFVGWLSQVDCAQRLQHADVLILPSVHDCGGAVVLEAMAMGLPVIATNWGGPADYLDDSCGILVNPDSREALVQGLAAAMEQLARSPHLRQKMGRAGQTRVREQFDWDAKVDRMLEIYADAIGSARPPAVRRPTSSGDGVTPVRPLQSL